ncbi:hypothetical protein BH09SUM1_BH09SUM1_07190 [soil metagenome]
MQPPAPTKPLLNPAEAWWIGLSSREDRSAAALLQTENLGGRHQRSVYELFAEMEEKDGHLYSLLRTRVNGLLGLRRRITPSGPANEQERAAASLADELLNRIPRLEELLQALLDAIAKGFAAVELLWGYDTQGRLTVTEWIAHPQEYFAFSQRGELVLLSPPFTQSGDAIPQRDVQPLPGRGLIPAQQAFLAPPRKFLFLRFGADQRNPYGRGLCHHAYWLYWFKKNTLKFWAIYNEKYGAPTAVASYAPGTSPEDRQRLREVLDSLQTDSSVVLPQSIELKLLEAGRSGTGESYRQFLDWCNDELSKIVLGATLTSGEGRRSGSLALGSIHQLVRQDYIDADARLLESLLNGTLIPWLCELNLGARVSTPRLSIETESPEDLNARVLVDKQLLSLGVDLPRSYFHARYGRPAPTEGEPALRYDDANFYQYHLQFGVLTINEVRARLGLSAVPWGNAPTSIPDNQPPSSRGSAEDVNHPPL